MTKEKDPNFSQKRGLRLKIIWIGWFVIGFLIGFLMGSGDGAAASYSLWMGLGTGAMVWWLWLLWFGLTLWTNKTVTRLNNAAIVWIVVAIWIARLSIASK